jgi:hypothetical protein
VTPNAALSGAAAEVETRSGQIRMTASARAHCWAAGPSRGTACLVGGCGKKRAQQPSSHPTASEQARPKDGPHGGLASFLKSRDYPVTFFHSSPRAEPGASRDASYSPWSTRGYSTADMKSTLPSSAAQRALERRRSAQHGGVRSKGWLGVISCPSRFAVATAPAMRGALPVASGVAVGLVKVGFSQFFLIRADSSFVLPPLH